MAVVLVAYLRQRFHLSPERTAGDLAVQGVTVVWVSYDCAQPRRVVDRSYQLRDGQLTGAAAGEVGL